MPRYCEVWYSFIREVLKDIHPDVKDQIHYTGYPGLDSNWLAYVDKLIKDKQKTKPIDKEITCLFIIRKFVKNNTDPYVYDIEEFKQILRSILSALKHTGKNIRLLIKPHPSSDFRQIKKLMQFFDYENYEIVFEPITSLLPLCDFVITVPSTSMIIPVLYGLPLVFFESSVKKTLESWRPKWDLFNGLQFYAENLGELEEIISEIISGIETNKSELRNKIKLDIKHYRKLYPDGALPLCMDRIKQKLNALT